MTAPVTVITAQGENVAVRPIQPNDLGAYLSLSGTSASIASVGVGDWCVRLSKTGGLCYVAFAASVTAPSSGTAPAAGTFPVGDGDVIHAPGGTALSAILTGSNTGDLGIVQLA